uniref:Uncharacterized protein n=1 Tax=Macaca mulatta TaxID=9544 RepID=A0A5F7ZGU1_MACMU
MPISYNQTFMNLPLPKFTPPITTVSTHDLSKAPLYSSHETCLLLSSPPFFSAPPFPYKTYSYCLKYFLEAGHGGSCLSSQHFGRPRQVDHLRSRVQDQPGQHSEILCLYKNTNISRAWSWVPVVPATQEAEAEESLEPERQRLQ